MILDITLRICFLEYPLYDKLTKFNPKRFSTLNIHLPGIISNLAILTQAFGYLISYKIVQNFISNKTYKIFDFSIVFLLVCQMYLGGSRSPIFRLVSLSYRAIFSVKLTPPNPLADAI